jgi:hypothetical protein
MEHENLGSDANGEATSGLNHEGESTNAMLRGGLPGSSFENVRGAKRAGYPRRNHNGPTATGGARRF